MAAIITPRRLARQAEFYHQLGVMLGSGVSLISALEMAGKHTTVRLSRLTIDSLILNLKSGMTFTEAMRDTVGWLPEFDIALLSVGEKSGTLDSAFKQLAEFYTARAKIIRDTISGLIMTMATLHLFLLIFPLGLFIACVQGLFEGDYARCLPFIIEKVVVFGGLYLTVFLVIYACQDQRGEVWRSVVENIFNFVPFLRTARKHLALARLASALAAIISSGMSIVHGWQLAAATCGSPRLRREIAGWQGRLASGDTPGELVHESDCFPELFANLYNTGERSGKLDETLHRLHHYYQDEGFRTLRVFTRVLNGAIYAAVALMVAFFIIRFYMGYFENIMNIADPNQP